MLALPFLAVLIVPPRWFYPASLTASKDRSQLYSVSATGDLAVIDTRSWTGKLLANPQKLLWCTTFQHPSLGIIALDQSGAYQVKGDRLIRYGIPFKTAVQLDPWKKAWAISDDGRCVAANELGKSEKFIKSTIYWLSPTGSRKLGTVKGWISMLRSDSSSNGYFLVEAMPLEKGLVGRVTQLEKDGRISDTATLYKGDRFLVDYMPVDSSHALCSIWNTSGSTSLGMVDPKTLEWIGRPMKIETSFVHFDKYEQNGSRFILKFMFDNLTTIKITGPRLEDVATMSLPDMFAKPGASEEEKWKAAYQKAYGFLSPRSNFAVMKSAYQGWVTSTEGLHLISPEDPGSSLIGTTLRINQ